MTALASMENPLTNRVLFEQLATQLVAENGTGSFGKLHLVSVLPHLPNTDWARLMPKIGSITEQILETRLGVSDACLRLGQGQYMLLFPHLSEAEGRVRAQALSQEIRQHLIGAANGALDVMTEVLPLARLRSCLDGAHGNLLEQMEAAMRLSAQPHGIALSVDYQGVWDAQAERCTGSRARIRRDFGDTTIYESGVLFAGDNDPLAVDVNQRLCHAATLFPSDKGVLFLPVAINGHTLNQPGGLEAFAHTAQERLGTRLVLEMAGDLGDVSRSLLRDTIRMFKSMNIRVAARVLPERDTAKFLRDCGVEFLCLNEAQAARAGFTHSALYALFTLVTHDVADLNYRLCLWNASSAEDVRRAVNLGFQYVTGLPVGRSTPTPAALRPILARDIFQS